MGSTPFLADMADLPSAGTPDVSTLRVFVTAGAPIPRVLVQRARLGGIPRHDHRLVRLAMPAERHGRCRDGLKRQPQGGDEQR